MELSKRLQTIASFVSSGNSVADIGTDHGYIPIFLVENGICPMAYAMDVNQGPLNKAIANVKECGLDTKITCILSDGLECLPSKKVDTVVIAGMGGDLVEQILSSKKDLLEDVEELVLSPQSHPEKVRQFLHTCGFAIDQEAMLKEDGKYYLVIRARKGTQAFEKECFYLYGEFLLKRKDPVMKEYLEVERKNIDKILSSFQGKSQESIKKRKIELFKKQENIMEGLKYYEM